MTVDDLKPGESMVLPDGSVVTRRFNGSLRIRGFNPVDVSSRETPNWTIPEQPLSARRDVRGSLAH